MNHIPDVSKMIDQFAHIREMAACPHCNKGW